MANFAAFSGILLCLCLMRQSSLSFKEISDRIFTIIVGLKKGKKGSANTSHCSTKTNYSGYSYLSLGSTQPLNRNKYQESSWG
jgi:hypothetical protein